MQDLIEQEQSGEAGVADHADGVDLQVARAKSCGDEQGAADEELPGVVHRCGEVLLITEQKRGSSEKTHNGRA